MGCKWVFECDGCGSCTEAMGVYVRWPEGWRIFTATPNPALMPPRADIEATIVCPDCWASKPLAEVLDL